MPGNTEYAIRLSGKNKKLRIAIWQDKYTHKFIAIKCLNLQFDNYFYMPKILEF